MTDSPPYSERMRNAMEGSETLKALCIFEDDRFPNFFPLSLNKPVFDLLMGTQTLMERIRADLDHQSVCIVCRPYLQETVREKHSIEGDDSSPVDTIFINGRLLAYADELTKLCSELGENEIFSKNGVPVAARLDEERSAAFVEYLLSALSDERVDRVIISLKNISGENGLEEVGSGYDEGLYSWACRNGVALKDTNVKLLSFYWQLIVENGPCIEDDFSKNPFRGAAPESALYRGVELINEEDILIGESVEVRSGTVLDASSGPIIIADGALIEPNAIIYGPCSIGKLTIIRGGAKVGKGTSIGEQCRIGGEVGESVIAGYSNKQHDGFLGHSYIGSWVNIGAGTANSDLKNNYGMIKAWCAGAVRNTGRRFLGLVCGDHSKIAINTRINTGSVIGFNANVFVTGYPPKLVPSFTWKIEPQFEPYQLERALETAGIMMDRRDVELTEAGSELFRILFRYTRLAEYNL
jgi:UDP-N-acetylglucosamine diphosphorylase/glucosamine-1-phosphate N-acetyltransferase